MLDLSHRTWRTRVLDAITDRNERLATYEARIKGYVGPAHRAGIDWSETGYNPLNYSYAAVASWVGKMAGGTPRFKVASSRVESDDDTAKVEPALNRLAVQSNMRQLNETFGVDAWFDYAVCLTTYEPVEGFSEWEDPPHLPTEHRIPPFEFIYDADQYEAKKWRFQGHRVVRDLDDVIAEAEEHPELGWNLDVLRSMQGKLVDHPREVVAARGGQLNENREQIEYHEIYCPEVKAEDLRALGIKVPDKDEDGREWNAGAGYHGAMFYVVDFSDAGATEEEEFVRDPHMYWGPRGGPYTALLGYVVPNDPLGLSPDTGSKAQQEFANEIARAMTRAIERGKNIGLVASSAPDLADAVKDGVDGDVIQVRDVDSLESRVKELKLGGLYPELMAAMQWSQTIAQMATGMGDSQMGEESKGITATQTAVANSATASRLGFLSVKFREFLAERARKLAWFLLKSERSVLRLGEEHGGGIFVGGKSKADGLERAAKLEPMLRQQVEEAAGAPFEDVIAAFRAEEEEQEERDEGEDEIDRLDITIEPYSTELTSAGVQQQQLQTMMGVFSWMIPAMAQFPFMEWDDIARMVGDFTNIPGMERVVSKERLAAWYQIQMQGAMMPDQTPVQSGPRLRIDRGPSNESLRLGAGQGASPGPRMGGLQMGQPAGGAAMPGRSTGSMAGAGSRVA